MHDQYHTFDFHQTGDGVMLCDELSDSGRESWCMVLNLPTECDDVTVVY